MFRKVWASLKSVSTALVVGVMGLLGFGSSVFAQTAVEVAEILPANVTTGILDKFVAAISPVAVVVLGIIIGVAVFKAAAHWFRGMGR